MVFRRSYIRGVAVTVLVSSTLTMATAQPGADPAPAFTAEQAAAGRAAYTRSCASCHMPDLSGNGDIPQLSGELFLSTWGTRSTKELVDYLSATMPPAGPRHGIETYLAISAYVLQSNGAAAGTQALSPSTAVPIESLLPADRSQ